jgi:hypothetical protein
VIQKPEDRNPKTERNPNARKKFEIRIELASGYIHDRFSDFGRSGFFRISDFGIRIFRSGFIPLSF